MEIIGARQLWDVCQFDHIKLKVKLTGSSLSAERPMEKFSSHERQTKGFLPRQ